MPTSFIGTWRCMVDDPPKKTGRFCVAHKGQEFGSAYYTAKKGDTHYPVGWSQVPNFRPNAWLDGDMEIPERDNSSHYFGSDYIPPVDRKRWYPT